jgi:hypothetical protein
MVETEEVQVSPEQDYRLQQLAVAGALRTIVFHSILAVPAVVLELIQHSVGMLHLVLVQQVFTTQMC